VCESSSYLNNTANVANYQQNYGNANYVVDDQLWSLFAQDDYRASRKLTLNLRYERQTLTDAKLNFAPRVGFVYDTSGDGSIIIRGGFATRRSSTTRLLATRSANFPACSRIQRARPGRFPQQHCRCATAGAAAPVRSLYVRPGQPTGTALPPPLWVPRCQV
jgi:hypothetical protein